MKVRLCVCAKTLVLILSINVFLCINVVQCTKCLIDIINPILKENGIPIINPQDAVNYSKNVKFGELTNFENGQDYFKSFLGCLFANRKVFFKMEFEMDKAWGEKGLFNKLNSIDTAIIFDDIAKFSGMLKNAYGDFYPLKNILGKEQNKIGVESNEEINIEDGGGKKNKNIRRCYYVLTSLDEMKNVIKIVEEGVVKERLTDYFSYTITFLKTTDDMLASGDLKLDEDDNPFAYAGHMKAIRGFRLLDLGKIFATGKTDFFKNCYKLQEIFDVWGEKTDYIELLENLISSCVDEQNEEEFKWVEGKDYHYGIYKSLRIYGIKIKRPEIKNPSVSFLDLFF